MMVNIEYISIKHVFFVCCCLGPLRNAHFLLVARNLKVIIFQVYDYVYWDMVTGVSYKLYASVADLPYLYSVIDG